MLDRGFDIFSAIKNDPSVRRHLGKADDEAGRRQYRRFLSQLESDEYKDHLKERGVVLMISHLILD